MESVESKVIELVEVVCRLHFYDDIDTFTAVRKLNEQGFEDVSAEFVQAIYEQLIKETDKTMTIGTIEGRVIDFTRAICELHRYDQTEESVTISNLKNRGFESVSVEFVRAIYGRLKKEQWIQNSEKNIYYTCVLSSGGVISMWSKHYFLRFNYELTDGTFHEIELFDCYNDKSIQFSIEKSALSLWDIQYLSDCFGILIERGEDAGNNTRYVVSLVFLDLYRLTCKKLQTLEYFCNLVNIYENKFDPTEFVLNVSIGYECFAYICKIVKTKIVVGDPIQLPYPCAYFKGHFYDLLYYRTRSELISKFQLFIYNVEQRTEERVDIDLPEGYYACYGYFHPQFVGNNIFVPLRFVHGGSVIARLNTQTRQLTLFDFATKDPILKHYVFNGNNLNFVTYKSEKNVQGQIEFEVKSYNISIRKPELLQNIAWITLVKSMKKIKTLKGPYESARYFLPYNSFIRCPFVEPEKDEKLSAPKKLDESD